MSEEADLPRVWGERTGPSEVEAPDELHREVLPAGVEPETRMLDLLDDVAARD